MHEKFTITVDPYRESCPKHTNVHSVSVEIGDQTLDLEVEDGCLKVRNSSFTRPALAVVPVVSNVVKIRPVRWENVHE